MVELMEIEIAEDDHVQLQVPGLPEVECRLLKHFYGDFSKPLPVCVEKYFRPLRDFFNISSETLSACLEYGHHADDDCALEVKFLIKNFEKMREDDRVTVTPLYEEINDMENSAISIQGVTHYLNGDVTIVDGDEWATVGFEFPFSMEDLQQEDHADLEEFLKNFKK